MIPIIIPVPTGGGKTPTCPHCGKPEDKKTTCRHCGHEYEDRTSLGSFLAGMFGAVIVLVLIVWIMFTMIQWLLPSFGDPSLEEVIGNQWKWIQSKTLTEKQKKARRDAERARMEYSRAMALPQYEPPDPRDPSGACGGVVTSAGSGMVLQGAPFLWRRVDE